MYQTVQYDSPVGRITFACDGDALVGLWIEGQKYYMEGYEHRQAPASEMETAKETVSAVKSWLDRYFAGDKPAISELRLQPAGSTFRRLVWKILCEIPYGAVITYGDIAKRIAAETGRKTMSGQAVGGAVGHNPISIIIPCHRVVGANGSLTGYAGGIDKKIKLLKLEGADLTGLYVPKTGTAL